VTFHEELKAVTDAERIISKASEQVNISTADPVWNFLYNARQHLKQRSTDLVAAANAEFRRMIGEED
jgi:hypothetical protein